MKTIPPVCPEPDSGPVYWRSLEQLSDSPEFQNWAEREFPAGASEMKDEVTRRNFMKLMSASFLFAGFGLTGCRRPEEKIYPFSRLPENYTHGVAQFFATAFPSRRGGIPLVVKSNEGRPTKIEGNSQHPDSSGATDAYAQASILGLYDPDRAQQYRSKGNSTTKEAALDALTSEAKKGAAANGAGLWILAESSNSPSRARVQALLKQKLPQSNWAVYEPVDFRIHDDAASVVAGGPASAYYQLDRASVVLALDSDFLGGEQDGQRMTRGFAKGRKVTKPGDPMNRLYAVESLMTLTGAGADHRLRIASSSVIQVAAQIAAEVIRLTKAPVESGVTAALGKLSAGSKVDPAWITECAKDLADEKNRGKVAVLAGYRQPLAVHLIAHAINAATGSLGQTVELRERAATEDATLAQLAQALREDKVGTLVILGGNPAYNAPADLKWSDLQRKAKNVIRVGYYEDETFAGCNWHLPAAHYLESWGDVRTSDGTLVPIQPLIAPLFDGITELEVIARLAGETTVRPYDIARETFAQQTGGTLAEEKWKQYLHDGYVTGAAAKAVTPKLDWTEIGAKISLASPSPAPTKDSLELVFHCDYSVDDGRYTNNGWLQEMPDPVSKMTWDNAVMISRKTAAELKLKNRELVEIELGGRKLTAPIWIQPGQADYSLGLALGYGREKGGRIANFDGKKVGFNAYALRGSAAIAVGAKVSGKETLFTFSCTQDHWSMEGRPIIREANLSQFNAKPDFAKNMDLDAASHVGFIPTDPKNPKQPQGIYKHPYVAAPELKSNVHQWGMAIDLSACSGCSACVIACQSENNIPIVGKDQVGRGREMHWMRLDRYFSGDVTIKMQFKTTASDESQVSQPWIDDPQMVTQPMLCQHCESAPCESVCPVNATVHDEEGLNVMAYNRCVGTRYCSNNCAWKVRRFNFFDYNKRPIENLYQGPLKRTNADSWELTKMAKNPDVTVRMRGVMEKCTFCIQRIEGGKIAQKVKVGASGDVAVPDGAIKTACQQVCPAEAITFGNILDPNSRVSKLKEQDRNYAVLGFLDTRPRLTYLAKVRNPNPLMPDYKQHPLPHNLEEYGKRNGDPFEKHDGHPAAHDEKKGSH